MATPIWVDLAVGATSKHDETAIFTIALLPDGRRRLLAIDAGHWTAPEILMRIRSTQERYRSVVRVESHGTEAYLAQLLKAEGIRVEAYTTTARNKFDPCYGIESLAVELERGECVVPDAPATRIGARELLSYTPSGHPGDRLMACWLAREAARGAEDGPLEIVSADFVFDPWGSQRGGRCLRRRIVGPRRSERWSTSPGRRAPVNKASLHAGDDARSEATAEQAVRAAMSLRRALMLSNG